MGVSAVVNPASGDKKDCPGQKPSLGKGDHILSIKKRDKNHTPKFFSLRCTH